MRRGSYPPVYVVDVHRLYETLMQADDAKTVMAVGHRFNLTDVIGWCAGNEAGSAYFYIPWKFPLTVLVLIFPYSQVAHRYMEIDGLWCSHR